jgi:hypothetical protein
MNKFLNRNGSLLCDILLTAGSDELWNIIFWSMNQTKLRKA